MGMRVEKIVAKALATFMFFLLTFPSLAVSFPDFEFFPQGGYYSDPVLDKIRFGRVRVQVGLAVESKFTDNVFQTADKTFADGTSEGRTEDLIISVKPSLLLVQERKAGELFGFYFFYNGEDQNYAKLGGSQDVFNHNLGGSINLGGPGGRADFSLGGNYLKTNSFLGQDFSSNLGNTINVDSSVGFANFVYSLSSIFKVQLRAELTQTRFDQNFSEEQDFDSSDFTAAIFMQTNEVLAYSIKYNYRVRSFKNITLVNDNSVSNQLFFSAKWEPHPLITSVMSLGYEIKSFNRFSGEDTQKPILQTILTYQPYQRTEFSIAGTREIIDSTFQGIQSYVNSRVKLGFSQKIGGKFTFKSSAQLDYIDYRRSAPDSKEGNSLKVRVDKKLQGSIALIYDIKDWLYVKTEYNYNGNISNFEDNDFVNNAFLLEISVKY